MSKAIVIVDVQYDFCEGGSMGVEGGLALADRLAEWVPQQNYDVLVTTQDNHIDPGSHFSENPNFVDSWPRHCEYGTRGAEIVDSLSTAIEGKVDLTITKGEFADDYSGFEGRVFATPHNISHQGEPLGLTRALHALGVIEVDIVGIATDYCVKATALDAKLNKFNVTVLKDFVVGIDDEKIHETLNKVFPNLGVDVK